MAWLTRVVLLLHHRNVMASTWEQQAKWHPVSVTNLLSLNDIKIHRWRGFSQAIFLVTVPSQLIEVKAVSCCHSRVAGRTLLLVDTVPEGAAARQGVQQTPRTLLLNTKHT